MQSFRASGRKRRRSDQTEAGIVPLAGSVPQIGTTPLRRGGPAACSVPYQPGNGPLASWSHSGGRIPDSQRHGSAQPCIRYLDRTVHLPAGAYAQPACRRAGRIHTRHTWSSPVWETSPAAPGCLSPAHNILCENTSQHYRYSFSNPWLVNFSVRLFSVTVHTTLGPARGAPCFAFPGDA